MPTSRPRCARTPSEIDRLLATLDEVFAHCKHRHVLWDPDLPPEFEARLVLDGWQQQNDLVTLVLEGALRTRGPDVATRLAVTDHDWQVIEDLHWLAHQEEVAMGFHAAWSRDITRELVAAKCCKAPDLRYVIATVDGNDCAFFSPWRAQGVGQIEDLFTHAQFRRRGIATALIARCVDDARIRGAGPVLVGARSTDTPKQLYAALGFRPRCVQRSYLKLLT